jgi:hypothetical protein
MPLFPTKDFTFDADLQIWDSAQAVIGADDITQVAGSDKILDLGAGRVDGRVIVDLTAIEVASNNERFLIRTQFSNSATFASGIVGGTLIEVGTSEITDMSADTPTGRYEIPFTNEILGTAYRYMRLFVAVEGTIATGIDGTAFVVKN